MKNTVLYFIFGYIAIGIISYVHLIKDYNGEYEYDRIDIVIILFMITSWPIYGFAVVKTEIQVYKLKREYCRSGPKAFARMSPYALRDGLKKWDYDVGDRVLRELNQDELMQIIKVSGYYVNKIAINYLDIDTLFSEIIMNKEFIEDKYEIKTLIGAVNRYSDITKDMSFSTTFVKQNLHKFNRYQITMTVMTINFLESEVLIEMKNKLKEDYGNEASEDIKLIDEVLSNYD